MKINFSILASSLLISFSILQGQPALPINPDLLTKQWSAGWIAPRTANRRDYGVFHFRRSFQLAEKPGYFIVHVTADNRYRLFVNGRAVGAGPARGDKLHWRYETYNLASYLKAGQNILAALVWNMGESAPVAQMSLQTGFLMQGNTDREAMVNTNSSN